MEFEQKNKFSVGEAIELMLPSGENVETEAVSMWNQQGEAVESCPHPGERIRMKLGAEAEPYWIMRKRADDDER